MFEVMFYLFKCFCIGTGIAACGLIGYEILKDWKSKSTEAEPGCEHDWYTFFKVDRWVVRRDLERSTTREDSFSVPRLGESVLEKRICLKCRAIEDEVTPYREQAIAERDRLRAREQRAAELLAEVQRGSEA
jgi:hypothetical protein